MKILNKLTLKNLRLNKTRTVVTVIGIVLSAALICVTAGMATSVQRTLISAESTFSGDFDALFYVDSPDKLDDIRANRNVKAAYLNQFTGCALLPEAKNEERPYICIEALDRESFEDCFHLTLKEGRFPRNSSELVLSQDVVINSGKEFKAGDKITLEVGTRTDGRGNVTPLGYDYGLSVEEWDSELDNEITEELVDTRTKAYTIVGFSDECYNNYIGVSGNSACCAAFTATGEDTASVGAESDRIFADYLPECEKDFLKITAQIAGLTENETNDYLSGDGGEELTQKLTDNGFNDFSVNLAALRYKGYALGDDTMTMLFSLAAIIIGIVILTSVFVIRNSFAISITEKTQLYGKLASVGATKRQIRRNVLFEGVCLGVIGIPLGLILGLCVIGVLTVVLNFLMADMLNGVEFEFGVPVWVLLAAAALSAVTILFSTLFTAVRASKIAPVEAIRANGDIKTGKRNKTFKSPKYIKRLFGTGGVIAYKNLRRSRKKYRTTVISIVVSVMLFVAISSFMDYGIGMANDYYGGYVYDVTVVLPEWEENMGEWKTQAEDIKKIDGIDDSIEEYMSGGFFVTDAFTDEYLKESDLFREDDGKVHSWECIYAFDNEYFKKLLAENNIDYEKARGKAVVLNSSEYVNSSGKTDYLKVYSEEKAGELEFSFDGAGETQTIATAGFIEKLPDELKRFYIDGGSLIVSRDTFEDLKLTDSGNCSAVLWLDTEKADEVEQGIYALGKGFEVNNIDKFARQFNALLLVMGIFIYGFITVITLIGVTNIFNTISTNVYLRGKEFAMLKSVGMTKKEFNRMIRLESLFYGVKSLLIGIPLGILGGVGIFLAFSQGGSVTAFVFPWTAIIISILFVFVIVWLIMKYSVGKVSRQNIIETIRNDNI